MRPHEKNELPTTRITSYGQDHIVINNQTYLASIILFPNHLEEPWGVSSARDLTAVDIGYLVQHKPAVLLLGTGRIQHFPQPDVIAPAYAHQVGIEIMDTMAACRTFNVLAAEGREVVAGLILGS